MNSFFIIFLAIPAIEIFLMIKIGGKIGALSTVSLVFLTAVIGLYFAKIEGIKTLKSGFSNLYQNKVPMYEIMSGASIAIAALLLITPGFFTDTIGFLLLIPTSRKIIINMFFSKKVKNMKNKSDILDGEIIEDKKDEI